MSWVKSLLQRPAVSNSTPPLVDNATSEELMKPVRNLFRNLVLCTTSQEREVVFVKLLPAFETCFAKCPPERITERFGEIYTLAHQAAKHLDLEVKRLGQGKPKADAAEAIFSFFESPSCSVILSGLILFSRCHDDVVEEVCRSNIPSTLCKCIFLFADLLPSKSTDVNTESERRNAVQSQVFTLLKNLVERKPGLQELLQGNNFSLLSRVVLSGCSSRNDIWRDGAMDVIVHLFRATPTMSKHKTRHQILVKALQERQFLANILDLTRRSKDVPYQLKTLKFVVELLASVSTFTPALEQDFVTENGYALLKKVILSLDGEYVPMHAGNLKVVKQGPTSESILRSIRRGSDPSNLGNSSIPDTNHHSSTLDEHAQEPDSGFKTTTVKNNGALTDSPRLLLRHLLTAISELSLVSDRTGPLKLSPPTDGYAQDPSFALPQPSREAKTVGNLAAYGVLMEAFGSSTHEWIKQELLKCIIIIITAEPANYFITRSTAPLTSIVREMNTMSTSARIDVYKLLSYLACSVNYVANQELQLLAELVAKTTDVSFMKLTVALVAKLVNFDERFTSVLKVVNILDAFCCLMRRYLPTSPPGGTTRDLYARTNDHARVHTSRNESNLMDYHSDNDTDLESGVSDTDITGIVVEKKGNGADMKKTLATVVVTDESYTFADNTKSASTRKPATKAEAIPVILEGLSLLVGKNEANLVIFQGHRLMPGLIELVKHIETRVPALHFCSRLIQTETFLAGAVFKSLMDLSVCGMRRSSPSKRRRRSARQLHADVVVALIILESVSHLLVCRASTRTLFRVNGGFAFIITQLADINGSGGIGSGKRYPVSLRASLSQLVGQCLSVLSASMAENDVLNSEYMRDRVGYEALRDVVSATGLLSEMDTNGAQLIYANLIAMALSSTTADEGTKLLTNVKAYSLSCATSLSPTQSQRHTRRSNYVPRSSSLQNDNKKVDKIPPAVPPRHVLKSENNIARTDSWLKSTASSEDNVQAMRLDDNGSDHMSECRDIVNGGAVWTMLALVVQTPIDVQVRVLSLLVGWLHAEENQHMCAGFHVADLLLSLTHPEQQSGNTSAYSQQDIHEEPLQPILSKAENSCQTPNQLEMVSGDTPTSTNRDTIGQVHTAVRGQIPIQMEHSSVTSGKWVTDSSTLLGDGVSVTLWRNGVFFYLFELVAQRSCHPSLLRSVLVMYRNSIDVRPTDHRSFGKSTSVATLTPIDYSAQTSFIGRHSSVNPQLDTNVLVADTELEKEAWCTQILQLLLRMGNASSPVVPPSINFCMADNGYAGVVLPVTRTKSWPGNAYTFMTWIKIERWCDSPSGLADEHMVCLYTIVSPTETWLSATISRETGYLTIRCGQSQLQNKTIENTSDTSHGNHTNLVAEFNDHVFKTGVWYHVALVHSRSRLKSSVATLYVNGLKVQTERLSYVVGPPNNSASLNEVVCVVGTPYWKRQQSNLLWACGPVWVVCEALSAHAVCAAYFVGPRYTGTFRGKLRPYQTYEVISDRTLKAFDRSDLAIYNLNNAQSTMPSEDCTEFVLHVANSIPQSELSAKDTDRFMNGMTSVVKSMLLSLTGNLEKSSGGRCVAIRNAVDTRSPPSSQSILACGLMYGDTRVHDGVCLSDGVRMVSGVRVVLDIIETCKGIADLEGALRLLSCTVRHHAYLTGQMEALLGYQIVAMALKKRSRILSMGVVNILFELVGLSTDAATGTIGNISAFKNLLLDYEIWRLSDPAVSTAVFTNILTLITKTNQLWRFNIRRLRKLHITQRLLFQLRDETLPELAVKIIVQIIGRLLTIEGTDDDMERIARFVVTTVNPDQDISDRHVLMRHHLSQSYAHRPQAEGSGSAQLSCNLSVIQTSPIVGDGGQLSGGGRPFSPAKTASSKRDMKIMKSKEGPVVTPRKVIVRNFFLEELLSFLDNEGDKGLARVLHIFGVQWVMLFINENTDQKSLILALRLLVMFLIQAKDRNAVLAQFRKNYQGFLRLARGLEPHARCEQLYFSLFALLLGVNISDIPFGLSLDIAALYNFFSMTTKVTFAEPQTLVLLMELERSLQHTYLLETQTAEEDLPHPASEWEIPETEKDRIEIVAVTNILFVKHLYTSSRHPFYYSTSFITALIGVLFPKPLISVNKKRTSSTTSASLHSHVVKDGICTVQLLDNPVAGHVIELLVNIILDVEPIDVTHGGSQTSRGSTKDDSNVNRTPRRESVVLSDGLVKGTVNVIEHVLGAIPAVDEPLAIDFQTRLFTSIIEHVDAMSSEQLVRYLTVNEGNFAHLICVAIHMADTVVNGTFNGPNSRVWGFLVRILADMEHHTTLETVRLVQRLHRSLNVCIVSSLMNIDVTSSELESVLSDLLDIQNVVFQPTNNDLEFLETLTKILLEILENKRAVGRDVAFNLWKLMFLQKVEEMRSISTVLGPNHEVLDLYDVIFELLMSNAVEGLGEYLSSKHITRDGLTRNSSGGWLHYSRKVASVREYSNVQRKHSRAATMQLQIKKDAKIVDTMRNLRGQTLTTIESIHTYESTMYGKYRQHYLDSQNYTSIRAKHLFRDLWRERGLYGAEIETGAYWKLDVIEGPSRVRRRMCRNVCISVDGWRKCVSAGSPSQSIWPDTADGQSTLETITLKEQEVISELSELKVFSSDAIAHKLETDELQNEKKEDIVNINTSTGVSAPDQHTQSEDDVLVEDPADANTGDIDSIQSDGEEGEDVDFDDETDNMTIMRQLEPGDTIQFCFNCSRIQGLDTTDSVLLLCKRNIYIIDGYRYVYDHVTQKSNIMEVAMAMAELGDAYKPVVPKLADNFGGDGSTEVKYTKTEIGDDSGIIRCPYNEVHEVHKRRFLLREVALEIFSADGRDHLLAFDKCDRDTVYKKLVQSTVGSFSKTLSKGILDAAGATLALAGVKELAEESKGVFSQLWGERSPTQRWVAGELSNFQYLMWINTIAGRSYNDLTQYPVFPWVLADYTSDSLDLNDPKTFRDLTKPMGNQTPERATYYKQRYQNWEDPTGETPPFHYGTHFSSAMIVSSYLIRMEPYTQMFLTLQGGHFDHPDRMFHSIKEAWDSASKNNTADVKELIPEFYYLPEFLKNSNRFRLGKKQTGESLDDVTLPAWAKGDVHEFIRKHRQALESPYVSAHIHQWIDLVFGYKQVGEDAQKAMNVFHHLSYEGAVDIDQISDPVLRQAVIGIINNFGQTPRQVFKKPHPSRKLTTGATSMQASNQNMALIGGIGDLAQTLPRTVVIYPEQLRPTALVVKGLRSGSGVGDIALVEKGGVVAVGVQQLVVVKTTNRFLSWEFGDNSLRLMRMDNGKCIGACENMHVGRICAVTFADEQVLITGGEDGCVNVWQFADHRTIASSRVPLDVTQKLLQTLHGHTGPITAVAASRPYSVILSGSRDTTCMIWDLNQMDYIRQLRGHTEPITAIIINNQSGNIVTCSRAQVRLWTINGELLAKRNITRADLAITCCVLSESSEWESTGVIITGHENGSVCVWRISFIPNSTSHKHIHKSDGNCVDSKNESVPSVTDGVRVDSVAARHSSSSNYSNDALLVDVGYVGTKECVRRFVMVAALRNDTAQAVTCLRLSRDLKRLYVGDANGCITQWALPSSVGPFQSDWETLEEQEICSSCETPLSSELIVECQDCNGYFCGRCARFSAILPLKRIYQPTSVCRDCYTSQYGATVGVSQCE
eukprot:CFRG6171T1